MSGSRRIIEPRREGGREAEPSARSGFSRNRLTRAGEARTSDTLAAALAHPGARVHLTIEGRWICRTGQGTPDPVFGLDEAVALGAGLDEAVLLGHDDAGVPSLAAPIHSFAAEHQGYAAIDLRSIAMQAVCDPDTEGQLGQAAHLLGWHGKSRFCARCGGETVAEAAGYRRRCPSCGDVIFPRTDPVTIMLVHDGAERCILGRQPRFVENFWSCLAGFVEPGETIEDAVRRETLEEAGVSVGPVTYLASQPWPFPGSLMIGCLASARTFDIEFDRTELEACRWFSRAEVCAMLAESHPDALAVPKRFAIAHHLIKAFADGDV